MAGRSPVGPAVTVATAPSIGISTLLGVLFVALKLTGVVAWSWVWVLSPFWIPLVFAVLFGGAVSAVLLLAAMRSR